MADSHLSDDQVEQLLSSPESQSLEFITGLEDPEEAAPLIAAMANSGGGRIVLGVADDGAAIGLRDPEQTRQIAERAAHEIEPYVPLTFDEGISLGRPIVVANVEPEDARGPFLPPVGAVVRRDSEGADVPLSEAELASAFSQGNGAFTSSEREEIMKLLANLNQRVNRGFKEAKDGRRWKAQLPGWIISGLIGAAMGAALTLASGI